MTFPPSLLVHCNNIQEAEVACNAIESFRADGVSVNAIDPAKALAERIEAALHKAPMNNPKEIVLKLLIDASPQEWVAYTAMKAAFVDAGLDPERAAAALRDLSWQMREYLLPQDTASFGRKIEVMAERSRASGTYRYRLTKAGRIAVARLFNK